MTLPGLMLLVLTARDARAEVLRHAVVVGSNAAPAELAPLLYAEDDADRFADLLVELGGFTADEVTVLHSPSRAALTEAIATHADVAATADEDLFLFYYSGHADQQGLRLGDEREPFDALRQAIRDVPAEVRLGVLDACRSGEITRLKGLSLAEPFLGEDELSAEGEAWLTAASADESAQESDRLRGSFFTHYLLSGLRGAADSGDGVVSLDEAYAYAYDRTVARTGGTSGGTQHPSYDYRIQGNGDLPLTDVSRASARLRLPEELAGVVTVLRSPDELPVAEVAKSAGSEAVLALPAGTYRLQIRTAGRIQEASFGLGEGAEHLVRPDAFLSLDGAVAAKGEGEEAAPAVEGWRRIDAPEERPTALQRAAGLLSTASDQLGHAVASGVEGLHHSLAPGSAAEDQPGGGGDDADTDAAAPEVASDGGGTAPRSEAPEGAGTAPPTTASVAQVTVDSATVDSATVDSATVDSATVDSETSIDHLDLRHSPVIASSASFVIPGAGQFYNGQWAKGAAFLGSWAVTTGGAFGVHAASNDQMGAWGGMLWTGPTPWLMGAQIVRGWAAADAWQFHKQESVRPVTGVTVSYSTLWALGKDSPAATATVDGVAIGATGLAVDWVMDPGFSLGLDRTGYLRRPDGTVVVDTGLRMMFGFFERSRVRPGLLLYAGLEVDGQRDSLVPVQGLAGGGANLRWYLTPRYFVEAEGRLGTQGDQLTQAAGLGFGVHLARPGQGRPDSRAERREREQRDADMETTGGDGAETEGPAR